MSADQCQIRSSTLSLRHNGRSFYWAGQLLTAQQLTQAAQLYSLCRQLDDIADEAGSEQARKRADEQLHSLGQALARSQAPSQVLLRQIYHSIQQLLGDEPLALGAMQDLVATLKTDLKPVRTRQYADLLQYCYGAAGTVGVMMTSLLGAQPRERALPHAIDLGIAMQMTNIARDVMTDARLNRRYLPAGNGAADIQPADIIADNGAARRQAWLAINDLLDKAEAYYASAWQGLRYLPLRPRMAIAVATLVYREIGRQILRRGEIACWQQRSVVSKPRKALLTLMALLRLLTRHQFSPRLSHAHNNALHAGIHTCLDAPSLPGQADAD